MGIVVIPAIYTGNAPLPFKNSLRRKAYFPASMGYANGAGELLQRSTLPCHPALGVKEGTSKELMSQDQLLQLCQMCSYELPILFTSWDTCMFQGTLLPQHVQENVSSSPEQKKLQRWGKAVCKGRQGNQRSVTAKLLMRKHTGDFILENGSIVTACSSAWSISTLAFAARSSA